MVYGGSTVATSLAAERSCYDGERNDSDDSWQWKEDLHEDGGCVQ